jgi:hypothetical protein
MAIPDVGGRAGPGRSQQPEVFEMQTSAQAQVAKEGLGMFPNTLEVPFTQLGGNVWKYSANSSKPMLNASVMVGIQHPGEEKTTELEQKTYEKIVKELSLKIGEKLKRNKRLDPEDQDPRLIILELVLRFLARLVTYLTLAEQVNPESYKETNSENLKMPLKLFTSTLEAIHSAIQSYKQSLAHPKIRLELQTMIKENISILESVLKAGNEVIKTEGKNQQERLQKLLQMLIGLQTSIRQKKVIYACDLTETLITVLIDKAAGLLIGAGPAILFFSLVLAAEAMPEYMGHNLNAILSTLSGSDALNATQRYYMNIIAQTVVPLFTVIMIEAAGIPRLSGNVISSEMSERMEHYMTFAATLGLALVANTNGISTVNNILFEELKCPKNIGLLVDQGLAFLTWNILLIAGSKGGGEIKSADPLLKGNKQSICQCLAQIKQGLDNIEGYAGARSMASLCKQAEFAAGKSDAKGYIEVIKEALKSKEWKLDQVQEECEQLIASTIPYLRGCYRALGVAKATTVINQAA